MYKMYKKKMYTFPTLNKSLLLSSFASLQATARMIFPTYKSDYGIALLKTVTMFPVALHSPEFGSQHSLRFAHSSYTSTLCLIVYAVTSHAQLL